MEPENKRSNGNSDNAAQPADWLEPGTNHEPWNESSESKEERARRMGPVAGWLEQFAAECDNLEVRKEHGSEASEAD